MADNNQAKGHWVTPETGIPYFVPEETTEGAAREEKLVPFYRSIFSALVVALQVFIVQGPMKLLITMYSTIAVWMFKSFVKYCPRGAEQMQRAIADVFFMPTPAWAGWVAQYVERLTGNAISLDDIMKEGIGSTSRSAMTALGDRFLKPMLGLLLPTPEETRTQPFDAAERFMSTNLEFQMSSWLLHFLGDAMSFGMFKSLKDLPMNISHAFGLSWLTWMVMGPIFQSSMARPLQTLFARMYTPEHMTIYEIIKARKKNAISYDRFADECLDNGFNLERANILYDIGEPALSDADMKTLISLGWMDESGVKEEMAKGGFDDNRSQVLAKLIMDSRKLSLIKDMVTEATKRYQEGVLDETTYRRYMQTLNYTTEEQNLSINLVQLQQGARRYLTPAQVMAALKKKKFGTIEARDYLMNNLGYTPTDADIYMSL